MTQNFYMPHKDYDHTLERSVLGVFLLEPTSFGSVYNILNDECFFSKYHKEVYQYLKKTFDKGYPVDLLTVARLMYNDGVSRIEDLNTGAFLTNLTFDVVSSAHLETWCVMLRELYAKREMIAITNGGYNAEDVIEGAVSIEQRLKKVMDIRVSDDWKHISQVGHSVAKKMQQPAGEMQGLTTGLDILNRVNSGFKPGMMVVLGARPAVGKSAYMGMMVEAIAKANHKVGVMSLEMTAEDNMQRMMAADSKVEFAKIDKNQLYEEVERNRVHNSLNRLSGLPIYFSDTAKVNIHDIRAKAEKLKRKHGLDILFIDYLQLVEPDSQKNKNREQEVSQISRGIKLLAMSLKIPIVILAQLNRDAADKEPELIHLRESGSIEQDADVVMFLHRAKDDTGFISEQGKLLVRKWRNGAPMDIELAFEKETMRFYDPRQGNQPFSQPDNPRAGIDFKGRQANDFFKT